MLTLGETMFLAGEIISEIVNIMLQSLKRYFKSNRVFLQQEKYRSWGYKRQCVKTAHIHGEIC